MLFSCRWTSSVQVSLEASLAIHHPAMLKVQRWRIETVGPGGA
jgi:hypothetical protein